MEFLQEELEQTRWHKVYLGCLKCILIKSTAVMEFIIRLMCQRELRFGGSKAASLLRPWLKTFIRSPKHIPGLKAGTVFALQFGDLSKAERARPQAVTGSRRYGPKFEKLCFFSTQWKAATDQASPQHTTSSISNIVMHNVVPHRHNYAFWHEWRYMEHLNGCSNPVMLF